MSLLGLKWDGSVWDRKKMFFKLTKWKPSPLPKDVYFQDISSSISGKAWGVTQDGSLYKRDFKNPYSSTWEKLPFESNQCHNIAVNSSGTVFCRTQKNEIWTATDKTLPNQLKKIGGGYLQVYRTYKKDFTIEIWAVTTKCNLMYFTGENYTKNYASSHITANIPANSDDCKIFDNKDNTFFLFSNNKVWELLNDAKQIIEKSV